MGRDVSFALSTFKIPAICPRLQEVMFSYYLRVAKSCHLFELADTNPHLDTFLELHAGDIREDELYGICKDQT